MGGLQRYAMLGAAVGITVSCSGQYNAPYKGLKTSNVGSMVPELTCPTMIEVDYDRNRYRTMLGASPDNPLICLSQGKAGGPEALVLNWYRVDRLRQSDVDHSIKVLASIVTEPVGFTINWNRFLYNNSIPYETRFVVAPDKSMTVGNKTYDVRVVTAKSSEEDNEYWIDKHSLLIMKYINKRNRSANYTVTALTAIPPS